MLLYVKSISQNKRAFRQAQCPRFLDSLLQIFNPSEIIRLYGQPLLILCSIF